MAKLNPPPRAETILQGLKAVDIIVDEAMEALPVTVNERQAVAALLTGPTAKKPKATPGKKKSPPAAPSATTELIAEAAKAPEPPAVIMRPFLELTSFEAAYALFTDYTFVFIVLGCGGTGSYLVPNIARLIYTMNTDKGTQHKMVLCDGDVVEPKNINRQNFIASDVTKNKAEVLANRYSTAFNIQIEYATEYIETVEQLQNLTRNARILRPANGKLVAPVIVGCLDTHKVRKMIYETYNKEPGPVFWLDSGNEEYAGQAVLGHRTNQYVVPQRGVATHQNPKLTWRFDLPTVANLYEDVLTSTDKFASELSCAERAVSNPQSIATNILAATILFTFVNNLMNGRIDYHAVTFNSRLGNTRTSYNMMDTIEKYGKLQVQQARALF